MSSAETGKTADAGSPVVRVAQTERSAGAMFLKRCLQAVAFVVVLPRLVIYWLATPVLGRVRAFANASEGVGRIPGIRGLYLRQAFYRATLAECGRDVYFGWLCAFSTPTARVGEGAYIGRRCGLGFVFVGDDVMLADDVQVLSGARQHGLGEAGSYREQAQEFRRVSIGRGAWLGAGSVVMADVGAAAVVGAGAVVTREVEDRCVVGGIPARILRRLDSESAEA